MMIASTLEKRSERIGMQGGSVAAAPSNPSLSTLPAAEQSVTETALAIIRREFVDAWPADDVTVAFDVVSDPKRAFLFTRMTHTASRQAWLRRQIDLQHSSLVSVIPPMTFPL